MYSPCGKPNFLGEFEGLCTCPLCQQDRADAQLAVERQGNQMMLAQAAAAKQAPVINNNNNNNAVAGGGGGTTTVVNQTIVRNETIVVPVAHAQHFMCCILTGGLWIPCWCGACMGCGCKKPCGC